MIEFNDASFVPCNDCANWESCQEEAYKQGKADGYSQAENDYHTQSEKDRQSSYNCGHQQGKAEAFADCILENGEYCWQECCETEHCKECRWLGNGNTIWFEQMQKGEEK